MSYLLSHGADRRLETEDGETAEDLVEEDDFDTLAVFKETKEETEKLRRLSAVVVARNGVVTNIFRKVDHCSS